MSGIADKYLSKFLNNLYEIVLLMLSNALSFRHVKVYNTTNYKVVHNFDYAASILSLALAVRNYIQSNVTFLMVIGE